MVRGAAGRGPGARVGSLGGGPRHMAGRVSDQWGSAAPRHLLARAARASSPARANTGSPARGRGRRTGGARSPGKDPRSFPGRKPPLPPRGRKQGGGAKRKCSLRAPHDRGGRFLACRPPQSAPHRRAEGRATRAPSATRPPPLRLPGSPGPARTGRLPASPWLPEERGRCP